MSAIRSLMTLAFLAVLGLAACAPIERNHGYVPPDLELAQVVPGQTTIRSPGFASPIASLIVA